MHTKKSQLSNFKIEYLCEIENQFENCLGFTIRQGPAQMGLNHKKLGVNNIGALPLKVAETCFSPLLFFISANILKSHTEKWRGGGWW